MKRERKQSRLQWFALDADAFLEDPRMLHLSDKEKGQWLLILVKMWRSECLIPDSIQVIRNMTGCTKAEAEGLRNKLISHRLLIYDGNDLHSPRMDKERIVAESSYNQKVEAGKRSAEESAKLLKSLEDKLNVR